MPERITRRRAIGAALATSLAYPAQARSPLLKGTGGVAVMPPSSGHLVVSQTLSGTQRSNYPDYLGMKITVGASDLIVSALGRWVIAGSAGAHTLKVVNAATGVDVPGGSVSLNAGAATPGRFNYVNLSSPITLTATLSYYVLSLEANGGDSWYDYDTALVTTADATVNYAVYVSSGSFVPNGGTNNSYIPVDLIYTLGQPGPMVGSPFPFNDYGWNWMFLMSASGAGVVHGQIASGTVTIDGKWLPAAGADPMPPINTMTMQYYVYGNGSLISTSPYLVGPQQASNVLPPLFPWTLDTTTLANGTYKVVPVFIDSTSGNIRTNAYGFRSGGLMLLVQNPLGTSPSSYAGTQVVPTGQFSRANQSGGFMNSTPDFVTYPGSPPAMNTHARPNISVAATNNPIYRDANNLYIEDMNSNKAGEFHMTPAWGTTELGGVFVDYMDADYGANDVDSFYQAMIRTPTRDGGRCDCLASPISTFIPAPDGTGYLGIELLGRVIKLTWDGSITTLAGVTADRAKPQFNTLYALANLTEAQSLTQYTQIGTIGTPGFSDFLGLNDLCVDPRDPKIIYATKVLDHFIIKIDTNFSPAHCTLYAGQEGVAGYVDGASTTVAQFNGPYSIIMADGTVAGYPIGTMFVADKWNGAIRLISPDGSTVSSLVGNQTSKPSVSQTTSPLLNPSLSDTWSPPGAVSFTPGVTSSGPYINTPQVIRFTSNPAKIVWLELYTTTLRVIDLVAHTVTRVPNSKNLVGASFVWLWFDIDTVGVLGPVDDIVVAKGVADNPPFYRISLDGSYSAGWIFSNVGRISDGSNYGGGIIIDPIPVYGWAVCFAKTRAHFIGAGWRHFGVYGARPFRTGVDPVLDLSQGLGMNAADFDAGKNVWVHGTSTCFPLGARPAFEALAGDYGAGLLGTSVVPSFDDLQALYPTDGSFTAAAAGAGTLGGYIQAGMAGTVPRPEITGNDLRNLCYYIRRMSLAGCLPTVAVPGPTNTDNVPPRISNVVALRLSPTSIRVTWTTDKPTIGMAVAGSPASAAFSPQYSAWSPIETSFSTSHNVVIPGLPLVTPIHFSVIAKDIPGNSVYVPDGTIA